MRWTALTLAAAAGMAQGQTAWTNAAGGNWNLATNWNPMDVPSVAGESALIDLAPNAFAVTQNIPVTLESLSILNASATVNMLGGTTTSIVGGVMMNHGLIVVNSSFNSTDAVVSFAASGVLSGTGELRLNGFNTLDARLQAEPGAVLTHEAGHTITGRGRLGGTIVNRGVVRPNTAGPLELAGAMTQEAGGEVIVDGGIFGLTGGTLTGGMVSSLSGGVGRVFTSGTMASLTSSAAIELLGGSSLLLQGGIINDGSFLVNSNFQNTDAVLTLDSGASLGGSGIIRLNGFNTLDARVESTPGVVPVQQASHAIVGRGRIAAELMNEGVISADIAGVYLEISGDVMQGAGGVCRGDEGILALVESGRILGGTVTSTGNGSVQARSGAGTLEDVFNSGSVTVLGGATLQLVGGIQNDGEMLVNSNFSNSDSIVLLHAGAVLGGAGALRLNGFNTADAQIQNLPGSLPVHGADHTIRGRGRIAAEILNHGTIAADNPSQLLDVTGVIMQSASGVCRGDDGTLALLEGAEIRGGTLDSSGTGSVQARFGTSTIGDVHNLNSMTVFGGGALHLDGTIVNDGQILVNSNFGNEDAIVTLLPGARLEGTGEMRLNGFNTPDAQLVGSSGDAPVNTASHTISGRGTIGGTLTNEGTISADSPSQLLVVSGVITQTASGVCRGDDNQLAMVDGAAIIGGTLDSSGTGNVQSRSGVSMLDGCTNVGTAGVWGGGTMVIGTSGLTNDGELVVNINFDNADAVVRIDDSTTIDGTGETRLNGFNLADARIEVAVDETLTLGAMHTLSGSGIVSGTVANHGILEPGRDGNRTMQINGAWTQSASGRVIIDVASTSQFDKVIGTGTHQLAGTIEVRHVDPFVPALGNTFVIMQGSSFSGIFDDVEAPDLGGLVWRPVYKPTSVELKVVCKADLSGSSDPNDPNYGVPDLITDAADFFYYLDIFVGQDPRADLTGSSDPNDPNYGIKDGIIDASDFFFFLDLFTGNCG